VRRLVAALEPTRRRLGQLGFRSCVWFRFVAMLAFSQSGDKAPHSKRLQPEATLGQVCDGT